MPGFTDIAGKRLPRQGGRWAAIGVLLVVVGIGCSRFHYRTRADCDAYGVVAEKTWGVPWASPVLEIIPDAASRLYDPTAIEDPLLPIAAPRLYEYQLPEQPPHESPAQPILKVPPEPLPLPSEEASAQASLVPRLGSTVHDTGVKLVGFQTLSADRDGLSTGAEVNPDQDFDTSPITIPVSAWDSIPRQVLARMLSIQRLQREYVRTFGRTPSAAEVDASRALSLEQAVELALLNSREYQTQKERLYRAALRLTFERYQFDLKPSAGLGTNGAAIDYRHTRGSPFGTIDRLGLPSSLQMDKVLRTGGDLLARLANNIVLTFNGPEGFASDLNSELLVAVTQTVFQRDIRFESLTQAERNVVYAARDFARFRKQLFQQLCEQYYDLTRTYRQVEIDSLNYFTLVRAFTQRGEEFRIGFASRVQVDQIEQSSLAAQINLVGTANRLERDLDSLKLRIGLPTESHITLDLRELERLTLADEVAVAGQLVQRIEKRLQEAAERDTPDAEDLLNLSVDLLVRMEQLLSLSHSPGTSSLQPDDLRTRRLQLLLAQARIAVRTQQALLEAALNDPTASKLQLTQRHLQLIEALLRLQYQQEQFGRQINAANAVVDDITQARIRLDERFKAAVAELDQVFDELQVQQLENLLRTCESLRADAEQSVKAADQALALTADEPSNQELSTVLEQVNGLLQQSRKLLEQLGGGLVPVDISFDDAMLTALVLRLDLMNQRGFLADNWRQIKLASDDLKSVLNLSASQRLEDFRMRDSETRLQITFDAPLNRRAQRNEFRETLIDYQAARRTLMELEDQIKFAVRNDLRDLSLSKQQYDLGVASAALAFERVAGTRLQLQFGVVGIQARDFLEAQTAYAASLSTVALRHIGYIVGRSRLFLNLELMEVDQSGGWPGLYDDRFQPMPVLQPPTIQPYGDLPPDVDYSDEMRRMLDVPFGDPAIFITPDRASDAND